MARGIDVDEGEFVAWGAFGGEFDIDGAAEGVPDFPGEGGRGQEEDTEEERWLPAVVRWHQSP